MEREDLAEWSHPDVTLPQLLSLVRAFMDMLILASGYQPTGLPALWRPQDVERALGWASLLEQIMNKIPVSKEGKGSRQALNMALQDMMLEEFFPEGLPKLSCEVLAEAKKILIYTMSHALGICNGQVESLIAAAYSEQQDWAVVLQHIRDRFMAIDSTKSISKAIQLATPMLERILASDNLPCCCQQWRRKALTYLLDEKTLYKLSGATVLFTSSEMQWRTALQRIAGQADGSKIAEIAELCCLQLSCHRRSILISKLLKPCGRISCSRKSLKLWQSRNHNVQGVKMDELEAYLWEVLKKKESTWWSLPPILVAAALTKGSPLFNCYVAELSSHMEIESYSRPEGDMLEDGSDTTDDVFARIWCLQFLEHIVHEGALQKET